MAEITIRCFIGKCCAVNAARSRRIFGAKQEALPRRDMGTARKSRSRVEILTIRHLIPQHSLSSVTSTMGMAISAGRIGVWFRRRRRKRGNFVTKQTLQGPGGPEPRTHVDPGDRGCRKALKARNINMIAIESDRHRTPWRGRGGWRRPGRHSPSPTSFAGLRVPRRARVGRA